MKEKLYRHLYDEHGLTLLDSDLQEIINIVNDNHAEVKDFVEWHNDFTSNKISEEMLKIYFDNKNTIYP